MMKMRLIAILIIAIFIKPYVIYAENRDSALFVAHWVNCVWRVYSDGSLEKVSCFQDTPFWYRGSPYGENSPHISPDQRYVAVIRQDDLWLFEPDTKNLIRLTQVAKPGTKRYASIEVSIVEWSWDSSKVLYHVGHGETQDPEGYTPDKKVRPAKYGFYVYDVKDKSRKFISDSDYLSNNFDKLVPNFHRVILEWTQDGTALINGNKINKELNSFQIDISRDGKWLVANTKVPREAFGKDPRCQIVKIDLNNYNIIPITPVGSWAEYQWPKFSPSGKQILYQWHTGNLENVAVDGKKIYTITTGLSNCLWINDNTIAFTSGIQITIMDSGTGEIKGRHTLRE